MAIFAQYADGLITRPFPPPEPRTGMPPHTTESIFHEALQRSQGPERDAYLDGACGNDAKLRDRVDALLRASDEAGDFLEPTMASPNAGVSQSGSGLQTLDGIERAGTMIGPYKLLQLIGEGGMGAVYMAEQSHPVRRKVALKVIKLGMDSRQVIARFEAERQALAMMDHPNIARVLDAGATETGRPYFVMELVRGVPITEYADTNKLPPVERLELFIAVCRGVQHAHQKGVIHRDLKPANVLVTLHDGTPVPKIIDFGIAKAVSNRLTDKTLFTECRQFVGTPQYMSPEQAEMSGLDIDTRTDIYSLGVLLFEMMTGGTPFSREELSSAGLGEIQKIIREKDPPLMSTRISSLGDRGAEVAKRRGLEGGHLSRIMRGDLDWIVNKSLAKDRTKRYETASELAADVIRHLEHQPVLAKSPGISDKVVKFFRRNRAAVLGGSVIAGTLIVATLVSSIGFVRARQRTEQMTDIVTFLQEALTTDDPAILGDPDAVVERGQAMFGDDHAVVGAVLMRLGDRLFDQANYEDAEGFYRRALDSYGEQPGVIVERMQTMTRLGQTLQRRQMDTESEAALTEAVALGNTLSEPVPAMALSYRALAQLADDREAYAEAADLWQQAIDIYESVMPDQADPLLEALLARLESLQLAGLDEALDECWADAVAVGRETFPEGSKPMVGLLAQYGQHLRNTQQESAALPILREAVDASRSSGGMTDLRIVSLSNLFQVLYRGPEGTRDTDAALETIGEFLVVAEEAWGSESPLLAQQLVGVGSVMLTEDRYGEGLNYLMRGASLYRQLEPDNEDLDEIVEMMTNAIESTLKYEQADQADLASALMASYELVTWEENIGAHLVLIESMIRNEDWEDALEQTHIAEERLGNEPRFVTALFQRAAIYRATGASDLAVNSLALAEARFVVAQPGIHLTLFDRDIIASVRNQTNPFEPESTP